MRGSRIADSIAKELEHKRKVLESVKKKRGGIIDKKARNIHKRVR